MKIIIVGAGKIGTHIAQEFIDENRDVILIEKDAEIARIASNSLDCLVVQDDGTKADVLKKAGVAKADWFLALTGTDEINIISCGLIAEEYPSIKTVSRVKNPFYTTLSITQKRALGLDIIINPANETANAIAQIIEQGFAESVIPLHEGQLQLRLVSVRDVPGFLGRTLGEIKVGNKKDFLIAAAVHDKKLEIPSGSYRISEGDTLYVLGAPEVLDDVLCPVEAVKQKSSSIVIIGATSVTERLVENLIKTSAPKTLYDKFRAILKRSLSLHVIDLSREACKEMLKKYNKISFSYGDCSEEGFLEEVQIHKNDLVICATESQTYNILTAQLVKSLGVKKSIAITLNDRYQNLAGSLDVDALVSIKGSTAASILAIIRRAHIRTIHSFYEDDVEIVELTLEPSAQVIGKKLKEIALPKGTLVAFVIRGKIITVPTGETELQQGDVVAIVVRKSAITKLETVFGDIGGN